MSVHESTFQQLKDMGIDAPLARAAAQRFTTADAAVNWCFSDAGQNWRPEHDQKEAVPAPLPVYDSVHGQGVTVSHNEIAASSATSSLTNSPNPFAHHHPPIGSPPPIPPRNNHANLSAPFASNNPFRDNPPPPPINIEDDEDEDLRKAIAMSQEGLDNDDPNNRQERERSVRASGVPPPSPEGEEARSKEVMFGPTEKTDEEGKMAMVPATSGPVTNTSKEDEELNRAIADSLMTASFHSASALQDATKPVPGKRAPGAPLVLYSESGNSTYAAHLLQGLLAIPQFREAMSTADPDSSAGEPVFLGSSALKTLVGRYHSEEADFVEVDHVLRLIRDGREPSQYPPGSKTMALHEQIVTSVQDMLYLSKDSSAWESSSTAEPYLKDPSSLFHSYINTDPPRQPSHVEVGRCADLPSTDLRGAMATLLWQETPNATVESFGDILTVQLAWRYGAPKEPWDIQERIAMDRFLTVNAARSVGIRAQQGVAAGNARRLKEKIEKLLTHRGQSTIDSLETLVNHYETSPRVDDAVRTEYRSELKAKLQSILNNLQAQKVEAEEQLKEEQQASGPSAFDTDDSAMNQHMFVLRAVMFYDGVLVPGQHLYMYVRHDDGTWWKIQEHQAWKVEFDSIKNDRTGLFMEGGPYVLLYSREGPRPSRPTSSDNSMDIAAEMKTDVSSSNPQETGKPETDDLMSFDETPPNELATKQEELVDTSEERSTTTEDTNMS